MKMDEGPPDIDLTQKNAQIDLIIKINGFISGFNRLFQMKDELSYLEDIKTRLEEDVEFSLLNQISERLQKEIEQDPLFSSQEYELSMLNRIEERLKASHKRLKSKLKNSIQLVDELVWLDQKTREEWIPVIEEYKMNLETFYKLVEEDSKKVAKSKKTDGKSPHTKFRKAWKYVAGEIGERSD
jgi:hypothetical protein